MVWLTCVALLGAITLSWYLGLTIGLTIASEMLSDVTGQALGALTIIEYALTWWGPIFDVIVLLWAVVASSQEVEPTSAYYR